MILGHSCAAPLNCNVTPQAYFFRSPNLSLAKGQLKPSTMKHFSILVCLFILVHSPLSAQTTRGEVAFTADFSCAEDFTITHDLIDPDLVSSLTCVVPDDSQGFTQLTAIISNPFLISQLSGLPNGYCWGIEWEVTGGSLYVDSDNDGIFGICENAAGESNRLCAQYSGNSSGNIGCSGMCGGITPDCGIIVATGSNPIQLLSSTVRVKWNQNLNDPNANYGVKVKLKLKTKETIEIDLGEIFPDLKDDFKKSVLKIENQITEQLCEKTVALGVNTAEVSNLTTLGIDCSNNGTHTISVDVSNVISRYCGVFPFEVKLDWYLKKGTQSFQKIGVTGSYFDSATPSFTFSDIGLNQPYTLRVVTKFGNMVGPVLEQEFNSIQGNFSIFGPDIVYPNGGDALGALFEITGPMTNSSWSITPSVLDDPFYFQVSGNQAVLFEPPVGGPATIMVNGTSTVCNTPVTLYKNICIDGVYGSPGCINPLVGSNPSSPVASMNNQSVANDPNISLSPSYTEKADIASVFNVYPSPLNQGGTLFVDIPSAIDEDENSQLLQAGQLNIYDMLGTVVFSTLIEPGMSTAVVTTKFLPGIYTAEIIFNQKRKGVKRFVIN